MYSADTFQLTDERDLVSLVLLEPRLALESGRPPYIKIRVRTVRFSLGRSTETSQVWEDGPWLKKKKSENHRMLEQESYRPIVWPLILDTRKMRFREMNYLSKVTDCLQQSQDKNTRPLTSSSNLLYLLKVTSFFCLCLTGLLLHFT